MRPARTIRVDKDLLRIVAAKALQPLWPGVVFSPLSPTRLLEISDPPLPGSRRTYLGLKVVLECSPRPHLTFRAQVV